jgi:adenylate cyclase class 2
MDENNIEIEAKFFVRHFASIRERLLSLGARRISERTFERNWRFDTADRRFARSGEVLRIREDNRIRLTYKHPLADPLKRIEIEFEVDDASQARRFLEALGFHVFKIYEKYRETFKYVDVEIVLDELPFGCFLEIEGPTSEAVHEAASKLDLDWKLRVAEAYLNLFERLRKKLNLPFSDATFEYFSGVEAIQSQDLGLEDALRSD